MPKPPRISDAEWEVMRAAWSRAPVTAQDIVDDLAKRNRWHPRTIRTLIDRLVRKGALRAATEGRRYLYTPRVRQEDCVREEGRSFVDRVFGGAEAPMLVHFVKEANLTPEAIAELKKILDEKEA